MSELGRDRDDGMLDDPLGTPTAAAGAQRAAEGFCSLAGAGSKRQLTCLRIVQAEAETEGEEAAIGKLDTDPPTTGGGDFPEGEKEEVANERHFDRKAEAVSC